MRIAYFDCFSGISGDMCLGALVDAGMPFRELIERLNALKLNSYEIKRREVNRRGFRATKIVVVVKGDVPAKKFSDITAIIDRSDLPERIKKRGIKIFRTLFRAEAKVHGKKMTDIHIHELSGLDCIIDIIGTLICLETLGIKEVISSPINLGGGVVSSEHGLLPIPAPATSELLRGKPIYSSGITKELTTPTGAALISNLAAAFGPFPEMEIEEIGIGGGGYILKEQPNILRVFIGKDRRDKSFSHYPHAYDKELIKERLVIIETNIDDANPKIYEFLMERLLSEGALDVSLTPIIMKKSRPGILLTVLCYPKSKEQFISIILRETTTLGVRFLEIERFCLKREEKILNTEFGPVRYKFVNKGEFKQAMPEYEDCKKIAEKTGMTLVEVMKRLSRVNDL